MQFNSYVFVLLFLPLVVILYQITNRIHHVAGKVLLVVASLVFYASSDVSTFFIFGISIIINYLFALLVGKQLKWRKWFLALPIIINVSLLFYFKYLNFTLSNISMLLGRVYYPRKLTLPLGISFFTFQQIAYLVASWRGELKNNNVLDYLAYILYFPKVLMGPLTEPADFISQLNNAELKRVNWENIVCGIKIFSFGLFKKMLLADTFSKAVSWGFSNISDAGSLDWLIVTLCYTLEIYFDFSGYSDMAVGSSLMLNITLPINFDSPYKALSIRDFWKRWHISLTKFLTKYIYIPLGGNRKGKQFTYLNTMIVFLISGIWHGAEWTFILWGILHGLLMVFDRVTEKQQEKICRPVRWCVCFAAVNALWLLFRSYSVRQWGSIIRVILQFKNLSVSEGLLKTFEVPEVTLLHGVIPTLQNTGNVIPWICMMLFLMLSLVICLLPENNYRRLHSNSASVMLLAGLAFVWSVICLGSESVFVYFNF